MERTPDSARAAKRTALASARLCLLAGLLRDTHQLAARLNDGDNGVPVLLVTGRIGTAEVIAGSVHFWWGRGQGPIGSLGRPEAVAKRIAICCDGMHSAGGAVPGNQASGSGNSRARSVHGARHERFPTS
jgi:hypothetical protein